MVDLCDELLPRMLAARLPGLDIGPGAVAPAYDGLSLPNLPGSICRWLGIPALTPGLDETVHAALPARFRHVVLVLADGLGLRQLQAARAGEPAAAGLLEDALLAPLTSIVPSTTAAALTSLWTGLPPAQHAITGYEIWLKEYSMIINAISHAPVVFQGDPGGLRRAGFDSQKFLTVPTLGAHLAAQGVQPFAYHHTAIYRSSLSTMLLEGVKSIPYRTQTDLWATLAGLLRSSTGPSYHYVYWGDLDELMHRFSPDDERILPELGGFLSGYQRFLHRLRAHGRGDTLVLLLADHGHISTPKDSRYEIRNHPELLDCLVMNPSGESRLPYLFLRPGQEERLRVYFDAVFPGAFRLLRSEDALQAGLLGAGVSAQTRERLGDLVGLAQGSSYLWWAAKENILLGRHGGLSQDEMLVPLVAAVV